MALVPLGALVTLLIAEAWLARRVHDEAAPYRNPAQNPTRLGEQGPELTYAVLGDSTAAGEGAEYARGIAMESARHLAQSYRVRLINLAVSGARVYDVLRAQLAPLAQTPPDLVLLAVGANDVTHLTPTSELESHLGALIDRLTALNCRSKLVLTAAGDLGTTPRLAQPLRWIAGLQTRRLNRTFIKVIAANGLNLAPIAEKTGPRFAAHPELFAPDRFHPNAEGYAVWTPVITAALDEALAHQPARCTRE